MVQWKMAGSFFGSYYWRYTHFLLNHDCGRKDIPPEKWSYGSVTNYNPSCDPYNPSYNPIEHPVSGVTPPKFNMEAKVIKVYTSDSFSLFKLVRISGSRAPSVFWGVFLFLL